MTTGRTLDEFRQAHDPTYRLEAVGTVHDRAIPKGAKRFIVTAAQNATPVHSDFWKVLCKIAEQANAEFMVIPIRYKNPTSAWTGSQQNAEWWAPEVRPYLWSRRVNLNPNLTLLADIKIQPTASSPLTGAEAISLASSGIIGHPKIHTRSVPTPQSKMAKLMMTSGACTVPNYSDSRAGRIGEFHHSLSAVLVELDGRRFYMRRLHFDTKTKSVTDYGVRYFENKAESAPRALALIMGDTHVDAVDPSVVRATVGSQGIVALTRPQHLIWHDLLDGYSCNPHHAGNPFTSIAKARSGMGDVKAEVCRAIEFVRKYTPRDTTSVIVSSNHDDFLRRWILSSDWRQAPTNAEFYLETALEMVRHTRLTDKGTEYPSPFPYWFKRLYRGDNVRVLQPDESFMLGGVELGMHGDRGPNGARGSIHNLRRIGVKTVTGHPHAPGEDEGCTQVGTSTRLRLEYTEGPSSWLNAHAILNADGKRQLVVIVNGKSRLP